MMWYEKIKPGSEDRRLRRYGILVLFVERSIFRTAEKHRILVLDLEHSNYLPHTRGMLV